MGTTKATAAARSLLIEGARGHLEAEDEEKLKNRLKRIEGQAQGLRRMVDEEAYCIDVLTQIGSVVSATEKVGVVLLKDQAEHCVRGSIEHGGEGRTRS